MGAIIGTVIGLFLGITYLLDNLFDTQEAPNKNKGNQPDNKTPFPTPENDIVSAGSFASTPEAPILCCCPKGHKLRVKSKLAGKVGVCPVCQLRFQVPFESIQEKKTDAPNVAKKVEILDSDPEVENWLATMRKTGPYQNPHTK